MTALRLSWCQSEDRATVIQSVDTPRRTLGLAWPGLLGSERVATHNAPEKKSDKLHSLAWKSQSTFARVSAVPLVASGAVSTFLDESLI